MMLSLALRRHRTVAGLIAIAIAAAGVALDAQRPSYTHIHWRLLSSVAMDEAGGEVRQSGPPAFVIPPAVQALHGQMVAIEGFMIPLDITPAGVSLFVVNGDADQCDFGIPPRVIDWILVTMKPGQRAPFSHLPTTVRGRLEVGAEVRNGRVTSLYRLAADRVTVQGSFGDR
jgi:hypothetical protein